MTEWLASIPPTRSTAIERAAACLRRGGLVAFPTETVYGLGVHALDREADSDCSARRSALRTIPLIVHVSTIDDVAPLVAELLPTRTRSQRVSGRAP